MKETAEEISAMILTKMKETTEEISAMILTKMKETAEEISAMILTKMKETAEAYLSEKVTHATSNKRPSETPKPASVPITFINPNPNSSIPLAPTTSISDIPEDDFLSQMNEARDVLRSFQNLSAAGHKFDDIIV
ncbi:hypothetical protein F4604DRAFT_1914766 [Suillus subluteus]|nr:hypothetical protein F4604DRAFT_1914766 [Suillus subluteus]